MSRPATHPAVARCQAYIHHHGEDPVRCIEPGANIRLTAPGTARTVVQACYCDWHGGTMRACERARTDWRILAPDVVGNDKAVYDAGIMRLDSRHTTITIRHEGEQHQPESWRLRLNGEQLAELREQNAWDVIPTNGVYQTTRRDNMDSLARNLCAYLECEYDALGIEHRPERRFTHDKPWLAFLGTGFELVSVGRYATQAEADAEGRAAWRESLDRGVEAIVKARGGTLSWGVPVDEPHEPLIIVIDNRSTKGT